MLPLKYSINDLMGAIDKIVKDSSGRFVLVSCSILIGFKIY